MNWPSNKKKLPPESTRNANKRRHDGIGSSAQGIGKDDRNHRKKQARDPCSASSAKSNEQEEDDEDLYGYDLNIDDLPCDTLMAVRSLVQRGFCITTEGNRSHIVLRHMIHEVLDAGRNTASTTIERELKQLRVSNHLRFIQFISHREDVAIVETDEYTKEVRQAIMSDGRLIESEREQLVRMFLVILKSNCRTSIRYEDLLTSICEWKEIGRNSIVHNANAAIDCFVSLGIMKERRETNPTSRSYWFSIPNIGSAVASLVAGRKEIITRVKRKMHKEISRKVLESSKLRSSVLPVSFHVKDLLSKGQLKVKSTPSGEFIILS